MRTPSRPAVFAAGAMLALAVIPATSALASGGGDDGDAAGHHGLLLKSSLAGSQLTDPVVFGAKPGGAPWVLDEGTARVDAAGHVEVEVEGLIIPALGKNPVPRVSASLACNGAVVATTGTVPFSTTGDAQIEATVVVPARCIAPVVMLNPNGNAAVYIAISGQEA